MTPEPNLSPEEIADQVAAFDQVQANFEREAKLMAVFFKGLTNNGMDEDGAFILTRDRLGYMHDSWACGDCD